MGASAVPLGGLVESRPRPVQREFTVEEANDAVVQLLPVVERMVEHGRKLADAQREQRELVTRIAGNGGDMQPSDLRELAETIQAEADAIAACAQEINAAGAQIKRWRRACSTFPRAERARRSCSAGSSARRRSGTGTDQTRGSPVANPSKKRFRRAVE